MLLQKIIAQFAWFLISIPTALIILILLPFVAVAKYIEVAKGINNYLNLHYAFETAIKAESKGVV